MAVKGTQLQKGKPIVGSGVFKNTDAAKAQDFLPCGGCGCTTCTCGKGGK